jgi:hypothetical protein
MRPALRPRLAATLGLAISLVAALPAAAFEYTHFEPLWIETGPPGARRETPALLNLPAGWQVGDAAVVLLTDADGVDALRGALLVSMIAEGAAVLELSTGTALDTGTLRADLATALHALRRQAGAGLVVAVGVGPRAKAVLDAEPAPTGAGASRFAAVATLGPGPATFRPMDTPPPAEGWGLRAPLLCTALASAAAAGPTPLPPQTGEAEAAATDAACRAALVPGGHLFGLR